MATIASKSLRNASNKGFIDWGEVFSDQVMATAIPDRLLHHAKTLNIKGESFRLKENAKPSFSPNAIHTIQHGGINHQND
jgi:DNA replication protein DnaC